MDDTPFIIATSFGVFVTIFFGIWAIFSEGYRWVIPFVLWLLAISFTADQYHKQKDRMEIDLKRRENKVLSYIQDKDPDIDVIKVIKIDFLNCHKGRIVKEFCEVRYYFTYQRNISYRDLIVPMSE